MTAKKGLKTFGDKAVKALIKEFSQLNDKDVFDPMYFKSHILKTSLYFSNYIIVPIACIVFLVFIVRMVYEHDTPELLLCRSCPSRNGLEFR